MPSRIFLSISCIDNPAPIINDYKIILYIFYDYHDIRCFLVLSHFIIRITQSSEFEIFICQFSYSLIVRLVEGFKKYGAKALKVAVGEDHTIILTTDGETMGCGVGESG